MTRLCISILICDVDAVPAHQHLVVELVAFHLVHAHLRVGSRKNTTGNLTSAESGRDVETTVIAGRSNSLVDLLSANLVLLTLILIGLQSLHLPDIHHALIAILSLRLGHLRIWIHGIHRISFDIHARSISHQHLAWVGLIGGTASTAVVVVGYIVHKLVGYLNLWGYLHISILLLVHEHLCISENWTSDRAGGRRITVLGRGQMGTPCLLLRCWTSLNVRLTLRLIANIFILDGLSIALGWIWTIVVHILRH